MLSSLHLMGRVEAEDKDDVAGEAADRSLLDLARGGWSSAVLAAWKPELGCRIGHAVGGDRKG
jgi:hypothetical protein